LKDLVHRTPRSLLPKKLLKYVQPMDNEDRIRLFFAWRTFLHLTRPEKLDTLSPEQIVDLAESFLGKIFSIPPERWHSFIYTGRKKRKPQTPPSNGGAIISRMEKLMGPYLEKLKNGNQNRKHRPPPAAPVGPRVIVRRARARQNP
jgi:hypothetical protein